MPHPGRWAGADVQADLTVVCVRGSKGPVGGFIHSLWGDGTEDMSDEG